MKKPIKLILGIVFLSFIIIIFIFSINNIKENDNEDKKIDNIVEVIEINKLKLSVDYLNGNKIDDKLTYGNISTHELKIKNDNKEKISFAIYLNEKDISNDLVTYDISYKIKEDESYENISKSNNINDNILLYNITIDEMQTLFLKIDFKSNKEGESTSIKGTLKIDNNVSENELFNQGIHKIQNNIDKKIESLNGLSESGYYTLNIKDFIDEDTKNYKGYVFIDALDISNPKFYYMAYNDKFMINDYNYTKETIKKSEVLKIDKDITKEFNEKNICRNHTKKECLPFSSIKYNSKGDKSAFSSSVEEIIELVRNKHKFNDKRVYIYELAEDIDSKNGLRGYILIDNSNSKNEYYLYLTNELYMVSGYNITKYGMFEDNSTTIRAYNETAYKLSSESKSKVCKFTGFTECYDAKNKKI